MKKVLSMFLVVVLCFGISVCGICEDPMIKQITNDSSYEITYAKAITYKNSIGTIWIQALFEVENTGTKPLYLSFGAYDLENETGALIKSSSMVSVYPDVIDPGEKAYYYEETTLDNVVDLIELNIIPRPSVEEAKIDNIRFPVTDFSITNTQYGDLKMLGRIENTSDESQTWIYIAAILFDENDVPIGQMFTILTEEIAAGDKIGFEGSSFSLPENITAENIARHEVFAYPLQIQF